MKILHTADWHIGSFPGPEKEGINLRGLDTHECINFLINATKIERPDIIVVSGDIFHQSKTWADRALQETNSAVMHFKSLSSIAPVCILYGTPNHDGEEHFALMAEVLKDIRNIYIFTQPKVEVVKTLSGTICIAGVPGFDRGYFRAKFPGISKEEENTIFTEEIGKIILGLRAQCELGLPSVLLTHYTVIGSHMENGQHVFQQNEICITPETIDAAQYDLVCLGHIHRPQKLEVCHNTFYSGAINTLTFNDEDQQRGFYIHELGKEAVTSHNMSKPGCINIDSKFIETPYRRFLTLEFDENDINKFNQALNLDWAFYLAPDQYEEPPFEDPKCKIVRVIYECSDEANKQLNKAVMEKELYRYGAFWVQEITPKSIIITANRKEISENSTPEHNLIEYLTEKSFNEEKISSIVDIARPIIDEAAAYNITARLTGVFEPVSIEVKNYRNYVEESFDFRNITFCTINGKNGAGKSSLFMDAILDCLFEQPREGDLTGWIRNTKDAKSGAIIFTFLIGDKIFRVSRTRAKSGRATLNLSECIDGEWQSRSKEKLVDTQAEIINVLGMDSLTFKSCALIMQDQYGIFLQADKEDRMKILGNILGLGIYSDMEEITKNKITELNRENRSLAEEIEKLTGEIADEDLVSKKLKELENSISEIEAEIKVKTDKLGEIKFRLQTKMQAKQRAEGLKVGINTLSSRKSEKRLSLEAFQKQVDEARVLLNQEPQIMQGVNEYNTLIEKEKSLLSSKATYDEKNKQKSIISQDTEAEEDEIKKIINESNRVDEQINELNKKLDRSEEVQLKILELGQEKAELDELEKAAFSYSDLIKLKSEIEADYSKAYSNYNAEYSKRTTELENLEKKTELLENSGCIMPEASNCKFLKDAIEANNRIGSYKNEFNNWDADKKAELKLLQVEIRGISADIESLKYNPEVVKAQRIKVRNLEPYVQEASRMDGYRSNLKLLVEQRNGLTSRIDELINKVQELRNATESIAKEISLLDKSVETYNNLQIEIQKAKKWLELEKQVPAAKEQVRIITDRVVEIEVDIKDIDIEISIKEKDLSIELVTVSDMDKLQTEFNEAEKDLKNDSSKKEGFLIDIGSLNQKLTNISQIKVKIGDLNKQASQISNKVVLYEELKKAFNQDGIPHNIIRTIIPVLSVTANTILSQMTGGKMNIEFVTERTLKSNTKKEIVTLDIYIEEAGKGRLPYLSKSGGEKVKSALSAILALAEIKSSRAGIQLGMLFIDEPPFMDDEGIQAYCDALETINRRYQGMKVMAITHDKSMKARFPQSVEVVSTENGSKVIFN